MSTISWWIRPTGYDLFYSRDSQNSWPRPRPPHSYRRRDIQFLTPYVPDGHGTWLACNDHGVTVGMLPLYKDAFYLPRDAALSGGILVAELADALSLEDLHHRLSLFDLKMYLPFQFFGVTRQEVPVLWEWDGQTLLQKTVGDDDLPLTSSSHLHSEVIEYRKKLFQKMKAKAKKVSVDFLEDFHRTHHPERPAFGICMNRDDAETSSLSHIRVDDQGISFRYAERQLGCCDFEEVVCESLALQGVARKP